MSRLHDGPILLADLNVARAARVAEVSGGKIVALEKGSIAAALGEKGRLRYAIDATGSTAAIATLLALLSGGGALALVGISHGTLDLDPNILVEREIALLGCHAFEDELPEAIALLPDLAPKLTALCETVKTLDAIPDAYTRLITTGSPFLKTIVDLTSAPGAPE